MIIATDGYSDFKAVVQRLTDVDGIFYTGEIGNTYYVYAFRRGGQVGITLATTTNPTSITTDFPTAVSISNELTLTT